MANVYAPESLGIKAPTGGFKEGGWYAGRQYWGGTLSDPGVIHSSSNQQGAGQLVSPEINRQSDAVQGNQQGDIERYLATQRQKQAQLNVRPTGYNPTNNYGTGAGAGAGMPGGEGAGMGFQGAPAINLQNIYDQNYASSGIKELEEELAGLNRQYTESRGKNNDNPYLSEATRVGREAKLERLHGERTANLRNEVAMKKADVETKLNLSLKQFDINSQQAKQSLEQFNTLLSMGALDNLSGEDIANITRSTGISSNMIQGAINTSKAKNVRSQLITATNDAGVVTASLIDLDTGQIISQNNLGAIGNRQQSGGGSAKQPTQYEQQRALQSNMVRTLESVKNDYGHISPQEWQEAQSIWLEQGGDKNSFVTNFSQYADPNRGDFTQAYGFKPLSSQESSSGGQYSF